MFASRYFQKQVLSLRRSTEKPIVLPDVEEPIQCGKEVGDCRGFRLLHFLKRTVAE